jgi:hypothetical protein
MGDPKRATANKDSCLTLAVKISVFSIMTGGDDGAYDQVNDLDLSGKAKVGLRGIHTVLPGDHPA